MTRVTLLSFAAFGLVAGTILAGCSPSPEQAAADNAAAANSGTNGTNAVDAANTGATPNTPTNETNAGATNAGATNGSTAQAGNEASNEGIDLSKSEPMVPFKLVSTKGQTLTNESLKGKVVLIDFWATWCGPCKAASPTMEKLYKTYGTQGLEIIGANTFEQSPELKKEAAASYAKEHGYTYTFTPNSDELAAKMGVENIPCFVFIDKKGNVRQIATGFHPTDTAPEFEAAVKKLLAEA